MVDLLHMNLMVERSRNWGMYLLSLRLVLPYFACDGHNNYRKSFYFFLQKMSALNPIVHEKFKKRQFFVRRKSTFWSGVPPDLFIEQTVIVRIKGSTGMTRSKSLLDDSRLVWTLSRPVVLTIDINMKEMCHVSFKSSDQHITLTHVSKSFGDTSAKTSN